MITDFTTIRRTAEMELDSSYTETAVKYENVGIGKDVDEYIALRDQASPSEWTGFGETATLLSGTILVDIFTPLNTGTQRSRVIAGEVDAVLGNQEIGAIAFGEAALYTVGKAKDAQYFQQVLQIPYQYISGQESAVC